MSNLNFGQVVNITQKMQRRQKWREGKGSGFGHHYKYWEAVENREDGCLFLGYRHLRNGAAIYEGDGVTSFRGDETIKVALVCPGHNRSPIYVPLDAIEEVNND